MIELTDSDKALILEYCDIKKSIKLNNGSYYIKRLPKSCALKELIGERIANEIFKLKCPKYHLAVIDGNYFILSSDLNLEGEFLTLAEMGFEKKNSLYGVWDILEQKYGKSFKEMADFIKIYIFDVLFHNLDRNASNVGILSLSDGSRKVVIFDNELILSNDKAAVYGLNPRENLDLQVDIAKSLNIYEDFERFLLESSEEFISLFKFYFELVTPEYFEKLVNETVTTYNFNVEPIPGIVKGLSETITELYSVHYYRLQLTLMIFRKER